MTDLEQKAKESYAEYSKDKCVDLYESYQYIDGFKYGYEQGKIETSNSFHKDLECYGKKIMSLTEENEELKHKITELENELRFARFCAD